MGRVVCVCEIKHGIHYLVSAEPDKALGNKTVEVLFAQVCPTLCNHLDGSLLGSSVRGLLQAKILERTAITSPGDLPNPRVEPRSPAWEADSLLLGHQGRPPWAAASCSLLTVETNMFLWPSPAPLGHLNTARSAGLES